MSTADIQLSVVFGGQYSFEKLQSDWEQTDSLERDFIKNKPDLNNMEVDTLVTDSVMFNETPEGALTERMIQWDKDNTTFKFGLPDGGSIQIGQEDFDFYTNVDTVPLTEGMPVSLSSVAGNRNAIKRTDPTSRASAEAFLGLVTVSSIAVNGVGRVTLRGEVSPFNTSGFAENATLYVTGTGTIGTSEPAAGTYKIIVGTVAVSANNGTINVNKYIRPKLTELSDVDGTTTLMNNGDKLMKQEADGVVRFITYQNVKADLEKTISKLYNPDEETLVLDVDVDGNINAENSELAVKKVYTDEGYHITNKTNNDIVTANGGTIALSDLKAGIYQLFNPSDNTTVVVEVNAAGDVLISGNVIISGGVYEVEAQQISTSEQTIELRRDATTGLPLGQYAGLIIKLYDGVNDGMIVIDNDGILRIGDVGDLQPVLTREEAPVDQSPLFFNSTTKRAETLAGTTTKTTPVDADAVMLKDSADSYKPKWLSWTNIKATLKTYFDTLYVALTGNQTIGGIKTFTSSPLVPDGATGKQAINYDGAVAYGATVIAEVEEIVGLPAIECEATQESAFAQYVSIASTTVIADKVLTILINGKQYEINVKEVV